MPTVCQRDMKVNQNFVVAYSRLFDFLCKHGGTEEVDEFCICFSDCIAREMTERVRARGLSGAFEYWSYSLPQEGATCKVVLDVKEGRQILEIFMADCPSIKHLETPNKLYCKHCDVIYRHLLEPLGYDYYINYNGLGQCHIIITESS